MNNLRLLLACLTLFSANISFSWAYDYPSVDKCLKTYSIAFDTIGNSYYKSGFVGNGMLGATIYSPVADTIYWELGRVDIADNRQSDTLALLYKKPRLPIGKFHLPMQGGSSSLLIDLHESNVSGEVTGANGFTWRTLIPHHHDVYVIELTGENLPEITFHPDVSISPRFIWNNGAMPKREKLTGYGPNPDPALYTSGNYSVCKQPLLDGGEYSTVWRTINQKGKKLFVASVTYTQETTHDTGQEAIDNIERFLKAGLKKAEKDHIKWWKDFYARSYIHVGEERYDAFFWSQLYKLGSATRVGGYVIDLMGPWYHNNTPWPAIWWNLNIQLTYSPVFAINHCDLALPLLDMLDNNIENLIKNVGPQKYVSAGIGRASSYDCIRGIEKEYGILTWTLFYYWNYCNYTNDTKRMTEDLFPLLKYAVNYYRTLLYEGEDNRWHMPLSHSPEYKDAEDANFELSILRWACQTLIHINNEYELNDSLLPVWEDIDTRLTDYPQDEDGFLIGKDVKLEIGHRHYSHLLMLYPFNLLDLNNPEDAALARKSIEYWLHFKNGFYVGYTYTGASSMSTLLGEGDRAYDYLNVFFDRFMQPNTFYKESGPVFETPMSALASYTEMLLISKPGEIYIMPAVPAVWSDLKYERLLANGGYEVSAIREGGKTKQVTIKSLYGGTCKVFSELADNGSYTEITFKPGEQVTIQQK